VRRPRVYRVLPLLDPSGQPFGQAALVWLWRQTICRIKEVLPDVGRTRGNDDALASRSGPLERTDVRLCAISNVDPAASGGDERICRAKCYDLSFDYRVEPVFCGGVERTGLVGFLDRWAVHPRRVEDGDVPAYLALVLFDKVPCSSLGLHLRCTVFRYRSGVLCLLLTFGHGSLVPILLRICNGVVAMIHDGSHGRCYHNALQRRAMLQCTMHDPSDASNSRYDDLIRMTSDRDRRRRRVHDPFDALHSLVKRAVLHDIRHDCELEPVPIRAKVAQQMLAALLRANRGTDGVAALEQDSNGPYTDVAVRAGDEDGGFACYFWHLCSGSLGGRIEGSKGAERDTFTAHVG